MQNNKYLDAIKNLTIQIILWNLFLYFKDNENCSGKKPISLVCNEVWKQELIKES